MDKTLVAALGSSAPRCPCFPPSPTALSLRNGVALGQVLMPNVSEHLTYVSCLLPPFQLITIGDGLMHLHRIQCSKAEEKQPHTAARYSMHSSSQLLHHIGHVHGTDCIPHSSFLQRCGDSSHAQTSNLHTWFSSKQWYKTQNGLGN